MLCDLAIADPSYVEESRSACAGRGSHTPQRGSSKSKARNNVIPFGHKSFDVDLYIRLARSRADEKLLRALQRSGNPRRESMIHDIWGEKLIYNGIETGRIGTLQTLGNPATVQSL